MPGLRSILSGVLQDSVFHPEGDVWIHTRAVRKSLDEAVDLLRSSRLPASVGLSLDELDVADRNLLRVVAWCHDVGKAGTTVFRDGRWIAPGHDRARYFNPVLRRLGPAWHRMWRQSSFDDRKAFVYLLTRHMAICDTCGPPPAVIRDLMGGNKLRRSRAILLVLFIMMDRLGCGRLSRIDDARLAIQAVHNALEGLPKGACKKRNCWTNRGV